MVQGRPIFAIHTPFLPDCRKKLLYRCTQLSDKCNRASFAPYGTQPPSHDPRQRIAYEQSQLSFRPT